MDEALIQKWYTEHGTGIFRFALSILKDRDRAEDVLQETFSRAISSGKTNFPFGSERPWLYRIARNVCCDMLRRQREDTPLTEATLSTVQAGTWGYEFFHLISGIGKMEQEIICLKILGGLTHREIAKLLGLTVHATKKRYERAIRTLRQQYEEGDV